MYLHVFAASVASLLVGWFLFFPCFDCGRRTAEGD